MIDPINQWDCIQVCQGKKWLERYNKLKSLLFNKKVKNQTLAKLGMKKFTKIMKIQQSTGPNMGTSVDFSFNGLHLKASRQFKILKKKKKEDEERIHRR